VRGRGEDRTGYAYSDEVTLDRLRVAASTARAIAPTRRPCSGGAAWPRGCSRSLSLAHPPIEADLARKIDLLNGRRHRGAPFRPTHRNVIASLVCEQKLVFLMTSDGVVASDARPLVRLQVTAIADDHAARQQGQLRRRRTHAVRFSPRAR